MPTQIQLRRGTNTQNAGFTGLAGEPTVNTTNNSLHIHDGSTQGGFEVLRADGDNSAITTLNLATGSADGAAADGAGLSIDLGSDGTATFTWNDAGSRLQVSSDLYVNGALTSNGNFAVNGTSNFSGQITVDDHVIPATDSDGTTGYDLGSPSSQWRHLYVSGGSVYLAGRRMRIDNTGAITVNTNAEGDYPEAENLTFSTTQNVLATSAALSIALGSI